LEIIEAELYLGTSVIQRDIHDLRNCVGKQLYLELRLDW